MKNNKELIDLICRLLEQKTMRPEIENWTERNFRTLSKEIEKKSGIAVSALTLKRITGKTKMQDHYHPQEASLDGICIYLGHANWDAFRKSAQKDDADFTQQETPADTIKLRDTVNSSRRNIYYKWSGILAGIALISAGIYYFLYHHIQPPTKPDLPPSFSFYISSSIATPLPYEAKVYTAINNYEQFSAPLNFMLYNRKLYHVGHNPTQTKITVDEYGPHIVKLFINNIEVSRLTVLAPTPGWVIQKKETQLDLKPIISNGLLQNFNKDTSEFYTVQFFDEMGIDGSDFTAEFRFTTLPTREPEHESIFFTVFGQFTKYQVELVGKKSNITPYVKLGNKVFHISKNSYPEFRVDLTGTHILKIRNRYAHKNNSKTEIIFDNKVIFTCNSEDITGEIQGINIGSRTGVGISHIKITDPLGKFEQTFGSKIISDKK